MLWDKDIKIKNYEHQHGSWNDDANLMSSSFSNKTTDTVLVHLKFIVSSMQGCGSGSAFILPWGKIFHIKTEKMQGNC